jgi:hypothetical protein
MINENEQSSANRNAGIPLFYLGDDRTFRLGGWCTPGLLALEKAEQVSAHLRKAELRW